MAADLAMDMLEVAVTASKAIPVAGSYIEGVLGTALQIVQLADVCISNLWKFFSCARIALASKVQ
jgi:hypothetical protein